MPYVVALKTISANNERQHFHVFDESNPLAACNTLLALPLAQALAEVDDPVQLRALI